MPYNIVAIRNPQILRLGFARLWVLGCVSAGGGGVGFVRLWVSDLLVLHLCKQGVLILVSGVYGLGFRALGFGFRFFGYASMFVDGVL